MHVSASACPRDGASDIRSPHFIPAKSSLPPATPGAPPVRALKGPLDLPSGYARTSAHPSLTKAPARRTKGAPTHTLHASGVTGRAGAGRAASRLFRLGCSARPARRTEGAPTHTRHASGVTGRLSRIAPRYAAGSRAKRAQAGAGPSPGSVSRQRCARGGRLLRRSDPGALLKHPTPCRAPRASPFATQRRVARRACPRPHRRSSPWRPKPGNPDCP